MLSLVDLSTLYEVTARASRKEIRLTAKFQQAPAVTSQGSVAFEVKDSDSSSKADVAEPWGLGLQDSATPIQGGINNLHDTILFYLVVILFVVSWFLISILPSVRPVLIRDKYNIHGSTLELIWTVTPAFILIAIAFPSFNLLYLIDEVINPAITIKVDGRQWYWSYTYTDYLDQENITFDSFMLSESDLSLGQLRLQEVDNRVVIPTNTHVRFVVTRADVIHSFGIPSLGIKIDAIPGRLNSVSTTVARPSVCRGACYEICRVNHGFMPVVVESTSNSRYAQFIHKAKEDNM